MEVPLRRDSEFGLTPAQFAQMPDRLTKKAATMAGSDDPDQQAEGARLKADAAIWSAAAKQLAADDTSGKWSIVWAKVKEADDIEADPDADVLSEALMEAEAVLVDMVEYGKRNSGNDQSVIQSIHDSAMKLGAMCDEGEEADESMVEVDADADPTQLIFRESAWGDLDVTFAEADAVFDRAKQEVWITPIRPGPGNKRDGMYYPERTVREAVAAGRFDGVLMFADHPTKSSEKELPERSVKDWVGVIKETVWDASRSRPRSRLKVVDKGVFDKWEAAPEHVAFSVMGGGRARPGTVNGESRRIVESMDKIRSVDWVTQAGAGGGIAFAESADEEFDMDFATLTPEMIREAAPDLYAAIREDDDEETVDKKPEAKAEAPKPETAVKAEPKTEATPKSGDAAGKPTPDGFVPKSDYDSLLARVEKMESKEALAEAREAAAEVVDAKLSATVLARPVREFIAARFAESTVGTGMAYMTEDELGAAVDAEISAVSKVAGNQRTSRVQGAGGDSDDMHVPTIREAKEASIDGRLGKEVYPTPRSDGEEGSPAGTDTAAAGKWASQI